MDKYLKRLCKAILDDRFNEKNYRMRRRYYGCDIVTNPVFSTSYDVIGFSASVYDESGLHYCDLQYDWEFNELTIDEMDYRDYFNLSYLDENSIYKSNSEPVWKEHPRSVLLECYTDGGGDMLINLEKPTKEKLQEWIDNFDIDEEVSLWWPNGQKGRGVPFDNMKEHYEDYEEFLRRLQKICDGMPY